MPVDREGTGDDRLNVGRVVVAPRVGVGARPRRPDVVRVVDPPRDDGGM